MKKKFIIVLALICAICCAVGLVACNNTNENTVVEVTNIELDSDTLTLTEGEEFTHNATITPSDATYQTVVWSSSDTAIAMVNSGKVVAIAEGEVTITATTVNGLEASCTVTV
ncbi:MAG: Ig-like domain-containing protein, partial [Clostridia bacterium]|nr:Ig-like domain-containing protein [Clostridia bacterium]